MPQAWAWLRWLPVSLLLLWSLAVFTSLIATPITLVEWNTLSEIWARYLLGFPGAALAAYSLRRQTLRLIAPFGEPRTLRMLQLVGLALACYAVIGGLLVPPAPFPPANWLNTVLLDVWLGIPVQVLRTLPGLVLVVAMIRTLEIFEVEIDRKLSTMEEAQILVTERERIRRDLHDRTLQKAYAAGLMVNTARQALDQSGNETVADSLSQAELILDQTVTDIRRYITELRARPTTVSLAEGLTELLGQSALPSMAEVDLVLDIPEDRPLDAHQVSHLLAIAGEALSNVARHARARYVQLAVQTQADYLCLTVTDDGQGLPPGYVAGYGLRNMHERARLLGGELVVNSQPGQGTRLGLIVPWDLKDAQMTQW
jgi:signal transduction histidine kinase